MVEEYHLMEKVHGVLVMPLLKWHYNGDGSYLYVNKTEIYKFKAKDNISWHNVCLGSVS